MKPQPLKLNLGCGLDHKQGWLNIDIDPKVNPDLVLDLQQSLPFADNSVSEILGQDVLEHLTKEQAQALLSECHRTLFNHGQLTLRIPNVFQIINQFHTDPEVMMEFLYGTTQHNGTWGSHKAGYTELSITKLLKHAGFTNITIDHETTNLLITCQKTIKIPRPKILIFQQSPDWGGAEEWMVNLINYFGTQNLSVRFYTNLHALKKSVQPQRTTQVVHHPYILDIMGNYKGLIKTAFFVWPATFWFLFQLIKAKHDGYNVIIMSGFTEKLLVTLLCRIVNIPIIWFEYGPLTKVFKRNFYLPQIAYRLIHPLASRVITISRSTKQDLINSARISLSKLKVIYPGVHIPPIQLPTTNDQRLTVGSLSRLTPEKGQRWLLQAWPQVIAQFPQAKLKIAGKGPDEVYLTQLAKNLKIDTNVEFLGFISDKSKFYQSLDIFVFPSIWDMEGFGLVLPEAMSFGVPIIASNHGPIPEIVDAKSGILVEKENAYQLAQAIINLLTNHSQAYQLGLHAQLRAHQNFDLPTQASKISTIIIQVVNENFV